MTSLFLTSATILGLMFPADFRWCVATAAHQVEGGNVHSDWWDWEQLPGKIKNGESSGAACDHWNRVDGDVELIRALGAGMYRFSVEWAKIEPREGEWDFAALAHYQREVLLLRAAGIEPMVTLHHFTLPRWVRAQGGWEWEGAPAAFGRFAETVHAAIGGEVRDWITVNEPMVHLVGGYLAGLTPPGKQDLMALFPALKGLLRAHAEAYRTLHRGAVARGLQARVGIAHHLRVFDPFDPARSKDVSAARQIDEVFNWAFGSAVETGRLVVSMVGLDEEIPGLAGTQDFIGLNYYTRDLVKASRASPLGAELLVAAGSPVNDMGWEIYPEGFYRVLKAAAEKFPGKVITVTENGLADAVDSRRADFLRDHVAALRRAMDEGVRVDGYCHWSLMDNFEWIDGFGPRFGLYEVDYSTFERKLRPSGKVFQEMAGAAR